MTRYLIFIFILNTISCFGQYDFEYFNRNNCDKYSLSFDNSIMRVRGCNNIRKKKFYLSKLYKESEPISDTHIVKCISSNILINGLFLIDKCFKDNSCDCFFKNRLDTMQEIYSSRPRIFKLCGIFKINENINSYFVTSEVVPLKETDSTYVINLGDSSCYDIKLYIINVDNQFNVISTACIGYYHHFHGLFGGSESDTKIKIINNAIISKTTMNGHGDLMVRGRLFRLKKSLNRFEEDYKNKFKIQLTGQISTNN